ncbi:MAG TPA: alpha/beta hydrolase [Chitinophagaceae bacterium]|nr:alpha/beta hydrolase [Chitinophagaceae bacterium]
MNYIVSKNTTHGNGIKLFYQDIGEGQPVVFIHGWPMSHEMWEYQVYELALSGLRCIAYDRRGFGKSSKPLGGYDYDTMADDLASVIDELQLKDVVLVGFSMGGGEVARYLSKYGAGKIAKAVLVASVTPYLLKTDDNHAGGVSVEDLAGMIDGVKNDRIGFLAEFGKHFFGVNLIHHAISTPLLEYYRMLGSFASPVATMDCIKAFGQTDFRKDMTAFTVPTLIIHGDSDKIVPVEISGKIARYMIPGSQFVEYEGAPHGLFYTHRNRLNRNLYNFINDLPLDDGDEDSVILPSNQPLVV